MKKNQESIDNEVKYNKYIEKLHLDSGNVVNPSISLCGGGGGACGSYVMWENIITLPFNVFSNGGCGGKGWVRVQYYV